jgi:hypothetical protein
MKDFAIFVSSSDNYSDIWDLFFDLFYRYWPEFQGKIYLQTQEKEYSHKQLNITCTKVGRLKHFGATLRAGLDKIPEENILFIMIDYIFMGKVNNEQINKYYNFFLTHNADSLRLVEENFENFNLTDNQDIIECLPPAPNRFFSYQIAFWNKTVLKEMALPHENPWSSEWYGDKRAHVIPLKLYSIKKEVIPPIPYDLRGCLHRSKWLSNAIEFLNKIKYPIDFDKRGIYQNEYKTFKTYIRLSWMLKKDGIKGSYWDLIKRKYLK